MPSCRWTMLVDPTADELDRAVTVRLSRSKRAEILGDRTRTHPLRPRLEVMDHHIEGVLLAAVRHADHLVTQEVHVVVSAGELTVIARTPAEGPAFDLGDLRHAAESPDMSPGEGLFRIFDEIAEDYLDLVEAFDVEIDLLEDQVEELRGTELRERLSGLRHDVLHVRRVLAPTRDAARQVLDGRLDLEGTELFPRQVEAHFGDAYDKLLRAVDGLDLSRDLIAGVRDYHQAQVANNQNEVMKRLTVITALLLVPTFIVGLYGQNFIRMPELHWRHGYAFSWGLILGATCLQVWWFRRKRWL